MTSGVCPFQVDPALPGPRRPDSGRCLQAAAGVAFSPERGESETTCVTRLPDQPLELVVDLDSVVGCHSNVASVASGSLDCPARPKLPAAAKRPRSREGARTPLGRCQLPARADVCRTANAPTRCWQVGAHC